MIKVLGQIFLAIIFIIVVLAVKCSIQSKMYNSDPAMQENLKEFKKQAQPLIDSLEAYHSSKGYYPRTIYDLPSPVNQSDYFYAVNQFNRVYKSMDCREKAKQLQGVVMMDSREYKNKTEDFLYKCVSGYSEYSLKTSINWGTSPGTWVFGKFNSQNADWSIGWCEYGKNNSKSGDCQEDGE